MVSVGPAVTVKPWVSVTTSVPVVTVTFVAPSAAAPVMLTFTVRLVAVGVPVGALAVTAILPKVTTELVLKCVKLPVMVTGMFVAACGPEVGETEVIAGPEEAAVTVKPLLSDAI